MSRFGKFLTVALSALVLGACAALGDVMELANQLQNAGYQEVGVQHSNTNGYDVLLIEAVTTTPVATDEDTERIATIVWQSYPQDVNELNVRLNGRSTLVATKAELEQQLGPRDPRLVSADEGQAIPVLLISLTFAVGIVIAIIIVARRVRRRRRRLAQDPPYPSVPRFDQPH
jgi:hypothetical protein